jgi:hypothetical protein
MYGEWQPARLWIDCGLREEDLIAEIGAVLLADANSAKMSNSLSLRPRRRHETGIFALAILQSPEAVATL